MTGLPDARQDSVNRESAPVLMALIVGCVLSVAIGFCDIALGTLRSEPGAFESFSGILPPLTATIVTCLVVYMVSWFVATFVLRRVVKFTEVPLALSLAAFWTVVFVTVTISDLTNGPHDVPEQWTQARVLICFCLSALFAGACYRLVPTSVDAFRCKRVAGVAGSMVVSVLALLVIYVWQQTYRPLTGAGNVMLLAGFVLAALLVVWVVMRVGHRVHPGGFLGLLVVLVVLGPLVWWVPPNKAKASLEKPSQASRSVKHVILLTVDTLRADALSCYNKNSAPTPSFDRIARDSVIFTQAISPAPWTLPSFASMMTGLNQSIHRASKFAPQVPEVLPTLAEHLRDRGYLTGGIGLNRWLTSPTNMGKGFDDYRFYPPPSQGSTLGGKILQVASPSTFKRSPSSLELTGKFCRWLEENAETDFFFWMHYLDPHSPYTPPEEYLPETEPAPGIGKEYRDTNDARGGFLVSSADERKWIKELYLAEVRYVDDCVGTVLGTLDRLGIYDDAILVLAADHGEEFWEHDGVDHGSTLYDESIHVPLMIKLPRGNSTVRRVTERVSTTSLMPTILDLCGIDYQAEYLSVGSLAPLLGPNPQAFEAAPIVSGATLFFDDRQAVSTDGMKYIRSSITDREELYDLQRDPEEQNSIAASSPDRLEKMRALAQKLDKADDELRSHFETLGMDTSETEPSAEMLRDLRSLGYVR